MKIFILENSAPAPLNPIVFQHASHALQPGEWYQRNDRLLYIERVLAYDEATGATRAYTVTATIDHLDRTITQITLGGEHLETTPEHPFYTRERGWVAAGKLWAGAHVRQADGTEGWCGRCARSSARSACSISRWRWHTFFVGDGQWLVHNDKVNDLEVLFGLNARIRGRTGMGPFKRALPHAKHWEDLGLDQYDPHFPDLLMDLMHNAKQIHFDVTDMRGLNGVDGVLTGPKHYNAPGSTNWELRSIWDDSMLRSKTTFYLDGQPISPAALRLLP